MPAADAEPAKPRFSIKIVSAALVFVLASLGVVINTIPGLDIATHLGIAGWSEAQEIRFQQLESCSERVMCTMTFADQEELERLVKRRPEHVDQLMASNFDDMPNFFDPNPTRDDVSDNR